MKFYLLIFSFCLSFLFVKSEGYTYNLDKKIKSYLSEEDGLYWFKIVNQDRSNIINYFPKNFSKNGDVDYSKILQKAINENSNIILPNFPIAVNYNGLNLKSNSKITFQENSQLVMLPNSYGNHQIFLIKDVENVEIVNANLKGERFLHKGTTGEWGMGINILSSKFVKIINPRISEFWGDGIYIGRSSNGISFCQDIVVKGGELTRNRRNGISIVSGKNISISDILIKNTSGASPMAGIDLEPNRSDEFLYNITLSNVTTENNKIDGIKIVFHRLINNKNVLVNIDNHKDIGSRNPLTIVGVNSMKNSSLQGSVVYTNGKWNKANSKIRIQKEIAPTLKLDIKKVNINGIFYNKSIK